MYLYKIGYHSCEESEYWQFSHEKKFSKGELLNIVEDCLFESLKVELKEKAAKEILPDFTEMWMDEASRGPSIQDIFSSYKHQTFFHEITARGFKELKFEHEISLFGWASSIDPDDWSSYTDDQTKEMIGRLKRRYENSMPK